MDLITEEMITDNSFKTTEFCCWSVNWVLCLILSSSFLLLVFVWYKWCRSSFYFMNRIIPAAIVTGVHGVDCIKILFINCGDNYEALSLRILRNFIFFKKTVFVQGFKCFLNSRISLVSLFILVIKLSCCRVDVFWG